MECPVGFGKHPNYDCKCATRKSIIEEIQVYETAKKRQDAGKPKCKVPPPMLRP
jgi:hypothetical protein